MSHVHKPACSDTMALQARLFDDRDAYVELTVQRIMISRRRANASGQAGEDITNIRAAILARRQKGGTA